MSKVAPNKHSWFGPLMLLGGSAAVGTGIYFAVRKAKETEDQVLQAISGMQPAAQPASDPDIQPPIEPGTGNTVKAHLTGYWPFTARADEKKMEGGTKDRKGKLLHTLEQHLTDPAKHPYVSVSGDDSVWPYGQRISINAFPGAVFRVVDTGSHFRGIGKVYRVAGEEPLDICVNSSKTTVPKKGVTVTVYPGDNFAGGKSVSTSGIKNQNVSLAGDVIEGRTSNDHDALARAIESEVGGRTRAEQVAAAWVMRNRATNRGVNVESLLMPYGVHGSPSKSRGYASTRKAATDTSRSVAEEVLGASDHEDPTGGALDYWMPEQQRQLRKLGDVHRAAKSAGDEKKASKYERYASYGSEDEVRDAMDRADLRVLGVTGAIELLGRK